MLFLTQDGGALVACTGVRRSSEQSPLQWLAKLAGVCRCRAQGKSAKRDPRRRRCRATGECREAHPSRRVIPAARDTLRAALPHAVAEKIGKNVASLVKVPKPAAAGSSPGCRTSLLYASETPKAPDRSGAFDLCALGRIRTCNLLIRSQMLYPLSYECLFFFSPPLPFLSARSRRQEEHYMTAADM